MLFYPIIITVTFTVCVISLGWLIAWILFLQKVPMIQELCNLQNRPTNSKMYQKINNLAKQKNI